MISAFMKFLGHLNYMHSSYGSNVHIELMLCGLISDHEKLLSSLKVKPKQAFYRKLCSCMDRDNILKF